jgi:hypothetical protein
MNKLARFLCQPCAVCSMAAFCQKSGTVLSSAWMLFLSPAKQVLDSLFAEFDNEESHPVILPQKILIHAQ